MKLPVLYGLSSTGKVKTWGVEVVEEDGIALYSVSHGYIDGKIQISTKRITKGKNIGRANETTPFEQAVSEAKSAWKRQLDKGYVEDRDNIPMASDVELFLPMLAHRYDQRKHKIVWPAYVQPKLDGARCLAAKKDGKVTLWSRKAKVFDVPVKLIETLDKFLQEGECVDGEIYVHEWLGEESEQGRTGFQRIIAALKAHNSDTDNLQYHIYDIPDKTMPFAIRLGTLLNMFKRSFVSLVKNSGYDSIKEYPIKIVPTKLVDDEKKAIDKFFAYMSEGYEGLMVRNSSSLYKYKNRSTDLQKIKEFDDDEFAIIGGTEATGKDAGTVVFRCQSIDGTAKDGSRGKAGAEFDVRPRGSFADRKSYLDNLDKLIGTELTVRFQGYTNGGVPRFPVGVAVRPWWDK